MRAPRILDEQFGCPHILWDDLIADAGTFEDFVNFGLERISIDRKQGKDLSHHIC